MTINEKLDLLRKEYVNATLGRKKGILFQAEVLKRALGKPFPQKDNYDIMADLIEKTNPPVIQQAEITN